MPEADPHIGILILAAGSSSRLGRPKQLLPLERETLLAHTVKAASASRAGFIGVVLGSRADETGKEVHEDHVKVIINPDWEKGMGSSLKEGLKEIPDLDALIISVCDQPYLNPEIFNALIEEWELGTHSIVASAYEDTIGVPALFDKDHFEALRSVPDDAGAKKLLFRESITTVPFNHGGVDIDTEEDWKNYKSSGPA